MDGSTGNYAVRPAETLRRVDGVNTVNRHKKNRQTLATDMMRTVTKLLATLVSILAVSLVVACSSSTPSQEAATSTTPTTSASVAAATTTTPPVTPQPPHAVLANITLPAGSTMPPDPLDGSPASPIEDQYESWYVTAPYDTTVQSIKGQLPIGAEYEGLQWCTETVDSKQTMWGWGDSTKSLWIVVNNTDPHELVSIDRRADESWDRAECDSGPTPDPLDEQFIAALGEMKGWPDRAQVIATKRDELIDMGRDACLIQEQEGEGSIATTARVMDIYEIPGDEAGAIVVAAFDVYCPES